MVFDNLFNFVNWSLPLSDYHYNRFTYSSRTVIICYEDTFNFGPVHITTVSLIRSCRYDAITFPVAIEIWA